MQSGHGARRDGPTLRDFIRLMRPHHYIKNLLVMIPLVFSGRLLEPEKLLAAFCGFCVFCAASSVVYIVNDIRDREKDRAHPTKRRRPIASGRISTTGAWWLAAVLAASTLLGNAAVYHLASTVCLLLYLTINWAYSAGLKNIPLLDVTILVTGFLLRMMYGAVITGIEISDWLYLTVIAFASFFALGKRRNELHRVALGQVTRRVLQHYTPDFLDKSMYVCLALTLAFYALWCMDAGTVSRYGGGRIKLVFTVPIVLLITLKYSMDVEGDSDGDPVEVLVHDRTLLVLCLLYLVVMAACLYM